MSNILNFFLTSLLRQESKWRRLPLLAAEGLNVSDTKFAALECRLRELLLSLGPIRCRGGWSGKVQPRN